MSDIEENVTSEKGLSSAEEEEKMMEDKIEEDTEVDKEEAESEEVKEVSEEDEEEAETIEKEEEAEKEEPEMEEIEKEKPEEEPYYEDAVNKGDFIKIEMTGHTVETGEVFDTTDEEVAREEGLYQEERDYGPKLVVVGEGWVLRGLDDRLPGLEEGEEVDIEIPPEDAFGERDPDNVQMIPYRILRSKGVNPVVGQELDIDGRRATIRSIGAGRVQVDYNHPLAGRKIEYNVKIDKIIEEEEEKIKSLIGRRFMGVDPDEFYLKELKNKYRLEIPEKIFFSENIQIAKRGLALDLLRFFPDLEGIEFLEVFERQE